MKNLQVRTQNAKSKVFKYTKNLKNIITFLRHDEDKIIIKESHDGLIYIDVYDGTAYNLFETATGSLYIKCTSTKTGNVYPVWIGEPTDVRHEGKAVYKMKSGKYCIYKIGKSGNPYPVWLKTKI